jgi:hypothetical protein
MLSNSVARWQRIADGFEDICGFSNCCFAIDVYSKLNGRMILRAGIAGKVILLSMHRWSSITRPEYFLLFCDQAARTTNLYITIPNSVKQSPAYLLPPGEYGLSDAGYTLSDSLLTPFPIEERTSADESPCIQKQRLPLNGLSDRSKTVFEFLNHL